MRSRNTVLLIILIFSLFLSGCSKKDFSQSGVPESGEKTAVITLSDNVVLNIRLFEKQAPKTVANFISLAKSGFYNGKSISMIVPGYMIRVGENDGYGKDEEDIEVEISDELKPVFGAVCMDLESEGTNSKSSFFILTGGSDEIKNLEELLDYKDRDLASYLKYGYGKELTEEELKFYRENGGAPWLLGHHTVFGQVYSGMNYVDILNNTEVSRDGYYTPVEDVIIEKIEIFTVK